MVDHLIPGVLCLTDWTVLTADVHFSPSAVIEDDRLGHDALFMNEMAVSLLLLLHSLLYYLLF